MSLYWLQHVNMCLMISIVVILTLNPDVCVLNIKILNQITFKKM